jgi:phytoene synthase
LRDVDEDAELGRLYLPREALRASGIDPDTPPASVLQQPGLERACMEVARRAEHHFTEAGRVMARCPRSKVRAPRLMAAVYRQILERLVARGWATSRPPVKVSKPRLVAAVLRHAVF